MSCAIPRKMSPPRSRKRLPRVANGRHPSGCRPFFFSCAAQQCTAVLASQDIGNRRCMKPSRAYDEIRGTRPDGARPEFTALAEWLDKTPIAELARRQQEAEAAFHRLGITFAVYGDEAASERIIPFDIVPRILTAAEWDRLSAGLEQRVRAINAFLGDLYGARKILDDGIIPAELILSNPQFRVQMAGAKPPHDVWCHIAGIDMVRTGPDEFFVLEDNARTPSGVSYMLENREAMLRLCPELFEMFRVRPVDNYPD